MLDNGMDLTQEINSLNTIINKYKKYERHDYDRPPPAIYGVLTLGKRSGDIKVVENVWCKDGRFYAPVILGVQIGVKFAEPQWYTTYPYDGKAFDKAITERKIVVNQLVSELQQALQSLQNTHGGLFQLFNGPSYSTFGWYIHYGHRSQT